MGLHESGTVSERHAEARADASKLTAGELAKAMKKAGYAVSAKELAEFATEWHHAGLNPRGGMGKCYFFRAADAEPASMARLFERVQAARAKAAVPRYGWNVAFRKDRGLYGRTRYQPVAELREFAIGEKFSEKYTQISAEEFAALRPYNGRDLELYESREAFAARMAKEPARA